MLKLAGERSEGTITWMKGPNTMRDHIRPNLAEGGDGRVAAGDGVMVTDDPEAGCAWANKALGIDPTLPSYRAVMDQEGATDAADLVLIGSKEEVQAGIDAYAAAGADEVAINMLGTPETKRSRRGALLLNLRGSSLKCG
jgi:5,10-methylenetetrahydromethanopterin reductase